MANGKDNKSSNQAGLTKQQRLQHQTLAMVLCGGLIKEKGNGQRSITLTYSTLQVSVGTLS
jgi:hypothetical protein